MARLVAVCGCSKRGRELSIKLRRAALGGSAVWAVSSDEGR